MVTLCLPVWGNVSQIDASFYFLTRAIYRSQPFPFLANTCCYLIFFNSSHPSRLKLYLTGVLVAFPWWLVVLSTFSWMQWPLLYLLWKNMYSDLFPIFLSWIICSFFNWVMYSLWILENSLIKIWLMSVFSDCMEGFSPSWWCSLKHKPFKFEPSPIYLCFPQPDKFTLKTEPSNLNVKKRKKKAKNSLILGKPQWINLDRKS